MTAAPEPTGPFRWDLVTPDQLGSLLDTTPEPNLWFLPELMECAGRVLARSANADLYFVGRSPDSLFDLLTGALARTTWRDRCQRLPLSLWSDPDALIPAQVTQFRTNLRHLGLAPHHLARRRRPVAFVDPVHGGRTYQNLFHLPRGWMAEERAAWSVIRTKLRLIGITARTKTSPNTWRWYQAAPWAAHVPRNALVSVSLDRWVWSYLADQQPKITRSFPVSSGPAAIATWPTATLPTSNQPRPRRSAQRGRVSPRGCRARRVCGCVHDRNNLLEDLAATTGPPNGRPT